MGHRNCVWVQKRSYYWMAHFSSNKKSLYSNILLWIMQSAESSNRSIISNFGVYLYSRQNPSVTTN